ncbi:PREDICTED: uncharacterized protein LOC105136809 [Populus euphratica]|uniref:Uncharacterized protein LOC105136809 n=1 Tax=Populus euphratica TaxID=75702 RepID=A0AAJ6Y2Y7_POPEU|nr:PREDICTED: uncharacterized protein LOC105136809 [Populus euphratica]
MKGSRALVAPVLTASTVALSSSSTSASSSSSSPMVSEGSSRSLSMEKNGGFKKEEFEKRFDGLRFIETLVTAHR